MASISSFDNRSRKDVKELYSSLYDLENVFWNDLPLHIVKEFENQGLQTDNMKFSGILGEFLY